MTLNPNPTTIWAILTLSIMLTVNAESADTPLILEARLYDSDTDGVAVGSPEGVNAVFDKDRVRFLTVWRGDLVDPDDAEDIGLYASNDRWGFAPVMPFSEGSDPAVPWPNTEGKEAGYTYKETQVDENGVPFVSYTFNDLHIEEHFTAHDGDNGFKRVISITGAKHPVRFLAAAGAHVDPIPHGFELNGAWETRIEAPNSTHSVEAIGGAYAALIYILTPVGGKIQITQEVEW
jgi:hypothetical protein